MLPAWPQNKRKELGTSVPPGEEPSAKKARTASVTSTDGSFEEVLLSRPITFVVGPGQREFVVHEKLVSRLSMPLKALLTGGMREAREGRVVWDDIDEQTFVRFSRWAYIGDYEAGDHGILSDLLWAGIDFNATDYSLKSASSGQTKSSCRSSGSLKKKNMIKAFVSSADWPSSAKFTPRVNFYPWEDYTNVFLSHARLYVLGDKYDISPLRQLAAYKLIETLKVFRIHSGMVGSILALMEYVLENTRSDDRIRSLLIHYMACIAEEIAKDAGFQSFVQRHPEAASALMAKMTERLD